MIAKILSLMILNMVFDGILNEMVEQFIILKIILVFDVGLFSMLFLRVA